MERMIMKTQDRVNGLDVDLIWELVREDGHSEASVHVLPKGRTYAMV